MPLSSIGEGIVLDALLADVYVSLHTADPGNTGASEVGTVGTGYARQVATFNSTGNNPTVRANNAIIQFPIALTGWGEVTHVGIWDAISGGEFIAYAPLAVVKDIAIDDAPRYPVGALQIMAN